MWDTASSTYIFGEAVGNFATVMSQVIGITLIAYVSLIGLGFGIRHLRKYITGRKF